MGKMSLENIINWRDNHMSTIRPYKAYRPMSSMVRDIASLPYDVLSRDESKKMTAENEFSFLHVTKAEIDLPWSVEEHEKQVYEKAKENLTDMISKNLFEEEEKESFYVYRLKMKNNEQIGLAVITSIDDYINNNIKKHEHTQQDKVMDRFNHLEATQANTDPVFMTYKSNDTINEIISSWISSNSPIYDFIALDDVEHTLWIIDDEKIIEELVILFKGIDNLYIADGHHISEAAVNYGLKRREENPNYNGDEGYNYFLSVLFPDKDLCILDYNRAIKDLNGYSDTEFVEILKDKFKVNHYNSAQPYKPEKKHSFGMYLDFKWYELIAKDELIDSIDNPLDRLDVSILKNNIFEPILELYNGGDRIDYIGGNRGLRELEFRLQDGMKVSFSLYPTTVEDFLEIAGSDNMMPYKSTWFEPKLRGGLFFRKLKKH